ncbi:amidohydrolase [Nakamurella sp. A5-74]|uniref:Amidohydrolase n=1 Tax=Nakamurella sp. A5-74 TaxID=3158264 RepID=A0AAU8DS09_9ACTN
MLSVRPTLFRHPRIHLGSVGSPPVTGLLVLDGQVIAAGDAAGLASSSPTSLVVDLPGAAVVPGLIDAHIHSLSYARGLGEVDLRSSATLAECLQRVADHAARLAPDDWFTGGHWDSNRWDVAVQPDRHALDTVTGSRPAILDSLDGHTIWANTAALAAAGIDADTPDPVGGEIVRDAGGSPTGILRETACGLITTVAPAATAERTVADLAAAQRRLLAFGVTAIHDIDGEDALAGYRTLHARGALVVRVAKAIPYRALQAAIDEGRRTGSGDERLRTGPVKLFSDGALGSRTCHMCRPFTDTGTTGIAVMSEETLWEATALALRNGIGVATHAIGDRANQIVLDVYERARHEGLLTDGLRVSIEHAQYLRPTDAHRLARLGVIASMQPTHCTTDWDLADRVLVGHDLLPYAWRSVLAAGGTLAFGSDAPIESPNPFLALHAAVTRTRLDGTPPGGWRTQEAVSPAEALAAHTVGGARAIGRADDLGSLTPGHLADLVCVDTDPVPEATGDPAADRAAIDAIACTAVLGTWSAGELAFGSV